MLIYFNSIFWTERELTEINEEMLFDEYCSQENKTYRLRNKTMLKLAHKLNFVPQNEAMN